MPLRNLLWSIKVIIPVDGITLFLLFSSVYWHIVILIQCAPGGSVLFLLLAAHTTCFLVLEFQEQSYALLNCQFLPSKTHFLKEFTFCDVPRWEHCVNHSITSYRFAVPEPLMTHPRNMIFHSCDSYVYFCQIHISPSQCKESKPVCWRAEGPLRRAGRWGRSQRACTPIRGSGSAQCTLSFGINFTQIGTLQHKPDCCKWTQFELPFCLQPFHLLSQWHVITLQVKCCGFELFNSYLCPLLLGPILNTFVLASSFMASVA